MNSTKIIKSTFSLFGNFSKLNGREADIKKTFEGYNCQTNQENLPNGVAAKVYRAMKENVSVTIRAFRIDIEFGYINDEQTTEDFMSTAKSVADMICTLDTIKGNRIAYNSVEFARNDNNELVNKCNKIFNIADVFGGEAKEFNLRVNHIRTLNGEEYNSVLILQDGAVTHNVTKEKIPALFVNKDINTVVTNTTVRFDLAKIDTYLSDMVLESTDRTNTIINKLC